MSLTAYIRYDNTGRIVPGGPVLLSKRPTVGNWQVVETTAVPSVTISGKLRAFIKLNGQNKIVASSLVLAKSKPATGKWIEVNATYEGPIVPPIPTTTTTTTTQSGLQIKWQNPMVSNACNSTDYVYATFDNTFLTATQYTGNFQPILDSGLNIGQFVVLSFNGEFRVNLIIQSATQLIAQESSWGGSC